MSIINEALKKTQQIRKLEKDRRLYAAEKEAERSADQPLYENATVAVAGNAGMLQKLDFLFTWKKGSYVAGFLMLIILAFTSYQHAKNTNVPILQAAITPEKLNFSGILVSDNGKIAIINKQSYHLGDTVRGMKILAIHHDAVDLQRDDKVIQLRAGASYML